MIRLEYTLTLQDLKAAPRLHRRQRLTGRMVPWIGPILLMAAITGLIVGSLNKNLELASNSFALAAGSLVLTVGMPIQRVIGIRQGFNGSFPAGQGDRRSSIEIDDDQILRKPAGTSELKVLWQGVYGFAQDSSITLIYTNKVCFLLFPTALLSPAERSDLDSLVARHGTRRLTC